MAEPEPDKDFMYETFPDDFMWGVSTSAYQIEGAWNEGGKGQNVQDVFYRKSKHNGNTACNSYHRIMEDLACLKELKVDFYRFSISWCRLFPEGVVGSEPRPEGLVYYNRLINALKNNHIKPIVTIYHWDLPQALQEKGGWQNKDIITQFTKFAKCCFENFGDRVKHWLTINEPYIHSKTGYEFGVVGPGVKGQGLQAGHNMLLAHARTYRMYNDMFKEKQKGEASIPLDADWLEPRDPKNDSHVVASLRGLQFRLGIYAHPIFINGDYPDTVKQQFGDRLPAFTKKEKDLIKGSADFFALNHYSTAYAEPLTQQNKGKGGGPYEMLAKVGGEHGERYYNDVAVATSFDPKWQKTAVGMIRVVPFGFRKLLSHINETYGHPKIVILENGFSDEDDTFDDMKRVWFLRDYIQAMLQAIKKDGCKVFGYSVWSLMDSFEWFGGYTEKFGLYHVDFNDPKLPRKPRASGYYFTSLIRENGFVKPTKKK